MCQNNFITKKDNLCKYINQNKQNCMSDFVMWIAYVTYIAKPGVIWRKNLDKNTKTS